KQTEEYCTAIRRGKKIDTVDVEDVPAEELAEMMVGREVSCTVDKKHREQGEKVLDIKDVVIRDNRDLDAVKGLSLKVHAGEILGSAGIDGNGQSELIEGITGLRRVESGSIVKDDKDITNLSPFDIINSGINTIPEDRQRRGLVLDF